MNRITSRKRVTRVTVGTSPSVCDDLLAVEEPLEIRVGGTALAITMRTPGFDFELAGLKGFRKDRSQRIVRPAFVSRDRYGYLEETKVLFVGKAKNIRNPEKEGKVLKRN